jgi:hypothetical protein
MVGNFTLNNWLTYHDRRLSGLRFVSRAVVIRVDLQLWGSRECRHRDFAIYPAAFLLVGCRCRGRGNERRVELCSELDLYLARLVNS